MKMDSLIEFYTNAIYSPHSGVAEMSSLLGCDAVSIRSYRCSEGVQYVRNVGNYTWMVG